MRLTCEPGLVPNYHFDAVSRPSSGLSQTNLVAYSGVVFWSDQPFEILVLCSHLPVPTTKRNTRNEIFAQLQLYWSIIVVACFWAMFKTIFMFMRYVMSQACYHSWLNVSWCVILCLLFPPPSIIRTLCLLNDRSQNLHASQAHTQTHTHTNLNLLDFRIRFSLLSAALGEFELIFLVFCLFLPLPLFLSRLLELKTTKTAQNTLYAHSTFVAYTDKSGEYPERGVIQRFVKTVKPQMAYAV